MAIYVDAHDDASRLACLRAIASHPTLSASGKSLLSYAVLFDIPAQDCSAAKLGAFVGIKSQTTALRHLRDLRDLNLARSERRLVNGNYVDTWDLFCPRYDRSERTPEIGVRAGQGRTPEIGVRSDPTAERTPEIGVRAGQGRTPDMASERDSRHLRTPNMASAQGGHQKLVSAPDLHGHQKLVSASTENAGNGRTPNMASLGSSSTEVGSDTSEVQKISTSTSSETITTTARAGAGPARSAADEARALAEENRALPDQDAEEILRAITRIGESKQLLTGQAAMFAWGVYLDSFGGALVNYGATRSKVLPVFREYEHKGCTAAELAYAVEYWLANANGIDTAGSARGFMDSAINKYRLRQKTPQASGKPLKSGPGRSKTSFAEQKAELQRILEEEKRSGK